MAICSTQIATSRHQKRLAPYTSMALPLTTHIFSAIVETPRDGSSVQIIPETPNGIIVGEDLQNNQCEIGIPKSHYLKLFLEGHRYLRGPETEDSHIPANYKVLDVQAMSDADLATCYLATLSVLSTTNECSSAWMLHEKALMELQKRRLTPESLNLSSALSFVECDFKYMLALATSRLDRINKSSMLWFWIRRLSVLALFQSFDSARYLVVLRQIMRSMSVHFANYSAGYTFLWLAQVASIKRLSFDESAVFDMVRSACRASLSDISLWNLYGKLLQRPDDFSVKQYNDSAQVFGLLRISHLAPSPSFKQSDALDELRWLVAIDCVIISPYMQLLPHLDREEASALSNKENSTLSAALKKLSVVQGKSPTPQSQARTSGV